MVWYHCRHSLYHYGHGIHGMVPFQTFLVPLWIWYPRYGTIPDIPCTIRDMVSKVWYHSRHSLQPQGYGTIPDICTLRDMVSKGWYHSRYSLYPLGIWYPRYGTIPNIPCSPQGYGIHGVVQFETFLVSLRDTVSKVWYHTRHSLYPQGYGIQGMVPFETFLVPLRDMVFKEWSHSRHSLYPLGIWYSRYGTIRDIPCTPQGYGIQGMVPFETFLVPLGIWYQKYGTIRDIPCAHFFRLFLQ